MNGEPSSANRAEQGTPPSASGCRLSAAQGGLAALLLLTACRATTSRPAFVPLPTATSAQVELAIPQATRALAERLAQDSISLLTISEKDGFIDSGWLDARTLERTTVRPLGTEVVRVRAWIGPAKEFWSELVVEASFRALADPSRPERELDLPLPADHPLQLRLAGSLRKLIEQYGDAEALKALAPPPPAAVKPDTSRAKPDSMVVKQKDTTAVKKLPAKLKPDTIPEGHLPDR